MVGNRFSPMVVALFIICLCTTAVGSEKPQNVQDLADGKVRPAAWKGVREAYLPILFPSSHASNLLALPNGDLLCAWFSGTREGESDVAIVMSRLPRGVGRWTKPVVIDHEAGRSFQNPVLFRAPDGRIWLFHTAQFAGQGQANSGVLFATSEDNGQHWSGPKPIFTQPGSFIRHPPQLLDDGAWLFPMYYTPSRGITTGAESHYSAVKISRDQGLTWKECQIPESSGIVQPNVISVSQHGFIAFFRSRYADWIYKSTSTDGCSWTAPTATLLPNNNSSFQVTRLKNGHLVLAFNNSHATDTRNKPQTAPRKPLSLALSVDNGETWPWVRDVQTGDEPPAADPVDRQEYSYPSINQAPDGIIHLTYTFRRRTIRYMAFAEKWIQQGTTVGIFKGNSKLSSPAR